MSILISVFELSHSFSARPLFEKIGFSIEEGEKIGLIGPNGAGKSTLLKILASHLTPDSGSVSFKKNLKVSYLEQTPFFKPEATVQSCFLEHADNTNHWESHMQAEELFSKLSLTQPEKKVETLSGGWKKRVALGRELMKNPDLLLLDEPTNHLDLESILWLEKFLLKSRFATLTITHDRLFLQRVSKRILELDRKNPEGILDIKGDYATYLEIKEQKQMTQKRQEISLKNTLRRETEWLRQGAKARTTKQQARIQRADSLKKEVQELSFRNESRKAKMDFQTSQKNPKKLIEAKNISKFIGSTPLFKNLDLFVSPGKRIGILGKNGCGKSTLIRVLLGLEKPTSGDLFRSDDLKVSYFEQNRETLNPTLTVLETLCPAGEYVYERGKHTHIRGYLDRFLFAAGQIQMPVGRLSGGEQSRLLIAKLMLAESNLLILDEPTNDLDRETLCVLEECLIEYSGAVLLVTHDRYFLDQVTTQIIAFDSLPEKKGELLVFMGLDQWEKNYQDSQKQNSLNGLKKEKNTKTSIKKKKLSFQEQKELDSMEEKILVAESTLAILTQESQNPLHLNTPQKLVEITEKMSHLESQINTLYTRWSELLS